MNIEEYLNKMVDIQNALLAWIEAESNEEILSLHFFELLDQLKIKENPNELRLVLHLSSKISLNHHRKPNFFENFDKIITFFKDDISKYFSNSEIFRIFEDNRRILIFLINSKILVVDEYVSTKLKQKSKNLNRTFHLYSRRNQAENFDKYFSPELNPNSSNEDENFYKNRLIAENESYLCQLIRNDSVEEFIIYVNKNIINLSMQIYSSIFEVNFNFNECKSLIGYAAFFGSIQIFRYLMHNGVALTQSLWIDAIHGKNAELIHLLEENKVLPYYSYNKCYEEAIKCHHNDIAKYILNNYMQNENQYDFLPLYLKYYNLEFIKPDQINEKVLNDLIDFDYILFAEKIVRLPNVNVNLMKNKIQIL